MAKVQTKPTDAQIAEVQASGGLKEISFTAEGVKVVDRRPQSIENEVNKRVEEKVGEVRLTWAQARRQQFRQEAKVELTRLVTCATGEEFTIKRGGYVDLAMAASLSGRQPNGVIDLSTESKTTAFMAALFLTYVVKSDIDKSARFESLEDATEFIEDSLTDEEISAIEDIFANIVDFNPRCFPEGAPTIKKNLALKKLAMETQKASLT